MTTKVSIGLTKGAERKKKTKLRTTTHDSKWLTAARDFRNFSLIFKEKTRQLLILVSKIITVILQIYFRNLKTCKNTSFGFTESQSQVWNNKNSRRSKLQKGELQIYISNGYQLCRSTALILVHNVSMKVPIIIKVLNRYSKVFPIRTTTSHHKKWLLQASSETSR